MSEGMQKGAYGDVPKDTLNLVEILTVARSHGRNCGRHALRDTRSTFSIEGLSILSTHPRDDREHRTAPWLQNRTPSGFFRGVDIGPVRVRFGSIVTLVSVPPLENLLMRRNFCLPVLLLAVLNLVFTPLIRAEDPPPKALPTVPDDHPVRLDRTGIAWVLPYERALATARKTNHPMLIKAVAFGTTKNGCW